MKLRNFKEVASYSFFNLVWKKHDLIWALYKHPPSPTLLNISRALNLLNIPFHSSSSSFSHFVGLILSLWFQVFDLRYSNGEPKSWKDFNGGCAADAAADREAQAVLENPWHNPWRRDGFQFSFGVFFAFFVWRCHFGSRLRKRTGWI